MAPADTNPRKLKGRKVINLISLKHTLTLKSF